MDRIKVIKLRYFINQKEKYVKIFGSYFVNNNWNKARIIYKNKLFNLTDRYEVSEGEKGHVEITLLVYTKTINAAEMFAGCTSLLELKFASKSKKSYNNVIIDLYDKNNKNIQTNEDYFSLFNFEEDKNLEERENNFYPIIIDKYNSSKYKNDSSYLKNSYKEYISSILPHKNSYITPFNLDPIFTDISYMFYMCTSLLYLPDISDWNTLNVKDMSYIFSGCLNLESLLIYLNGILIKLLI